MGQGVMIRRYLAVGLVMCVSVAMADMVSAQNQSLVLENFQAKEADGFPSIGNMKINEASLRAGMRIRSKQRTV